MSQEEEMRVLGTMKPLSARPFGEKRAMDAAIAASVAAATSEIADEGQLRRTRRMFPSKAPLPPFVPIDAAADGVWECGAAAADDDTSRLRRPSKEPLRPIAQQTVPQEIREKMLLQQKANAMRRAVRARYAPKRKNDGDIDECDF